jgi:DNA-binding transcriptional ArsR family regulator
MDFSTDRHIGDILKEHNIVLKGADAATREGYTQVPNFLLKLKTLSSGDKMTFAMLLAYAWQNDFCFPGQAKLAEDMGLNERTVRRHVQALEKAGLLVIQQRGQGKTNIYELNLVVTKGKVRKVRPIQTGQKRPVLTGHKLPL